MKTPTRSPVHILHVHSTMSMLDGASSVQEWVNHAADRGLGFCSCTDHGWLSGLHDLISLSKEKKITPIPGCEFYLKPHPSHKFSDKEYDYFHLTVWAISMIGYKNLIALSSRSWTDKRPVTLWGKARPRILWEDLEAYNEGLVVGSGCIEGPIGKCLLKGEVDQAVINASMLKGIFGDRMFFEIMPATVDRDYVKGDSIVVEGENGVIYHFMPTDILQTDMGEMTALEATKRRPREVFVVSPIRMQDGMIDDVIETPEAADDIVEVEFNQDLHPPIIVGDGDYSIITQ